MCYPNSALISRTAINKKILKLYSVTFIANFQFKKKVSVFNKVITKILGNPLVKCDVTQSGFQVKAPYQAIWEDSTNGNNKRLQSDVILSKITITMYICMPNI